MIFKIFSKIIVILAYLKLLHLWPDHPLISEFEGGIMPLVGWPINFPLELPLNKASKESIKQSKLNTLICLFYHQHCLHVLADSVRRPAGQLSHINRLKRSSNKLLKLNRNCLFSWKQLILLYWDQGLQRAIPANWDQFESLCLLAG